MADIQKLPLTSALPRWAYIVLAIACIFMGLWASSVTLQYFEHGAKALEADPVMQALALSAALMFVASEMGAFGLAALLTERQLWARRWMLYGFAGAVLALEVFTIVAVQLALTVGADMTQATSADQEKDLRARIAKIEADAAAKRATADQQRATAKNAYELHLAGKSGDKAAAEQAKTDALYAELKTVQAQKRPTLVGLLGQKTAIAYAVARGVLVSLGGLVFFGVAGALVRAARGGVLSVDQQILQLLHELRGTPGALGAPRAFAALQEAPQPAIEAKPAAPAKQAATPFYSSWTGKGIPLATVGALGALGAAQTVQAAPVAPAAAPVKVDSAAAVTPVNVNPPPPVNVNPPAAVTPVNDDAPRKARKARVAHDGAVMDTGVGEHDGYRYRRALEGVKAGTMRPSRDGLFAAVGASAPTAKRYLAAMAEAGAIVPNPDGPGWIPAPKKAKAKKGGAA